MRDWKLRDTVMLIFMVAVVAIMLMQMLQNDRLYNHVTQAISLLENMAGGGPLASRAGASEAAVGSTTQPAQSQWMVANCEPGGAVILHDSGRPANLNIITLKDAVGDMILGERGLVYESLLERDRDTLAFKGLLAESWSISEDKLKLTFKIKPAAHWSDGKPVTADDVVFSFRALMIPTVDAQSRQVYFLDCSKVEALDERTVRFHWTKKYYKSLETAGGLYIIPKHILDPDNLINKDEKAFAKKINAWDPPAQSPLPVGSGPFILESWDKAGNRVILRRNEDYWGPKAPLREIVFRFIPNDTAALQALKADELDYMILGSEQYHNQTNDPAFLAHFRKLNYVRADDGYSYIGWNCRRKPFDDRRVRQAMSYCIPRKLIVEKLFYNLRQLANGPFNAGSPQASPNVPKDGWPFDPAKAKTLLTEAGFRPNSDGILEHDGRPLEFSLMIPAGIPQYMNIAALIQDELSKIGVKMKAEPYEWSVFIEKLDNRDFDASVSAWVGAIEEDPYQIWHSSSYENKGSNHIGYSNREVDKLIVEAREEFDETKRNQIYHRIHEILYEDEPYSFMVTGPRLEAVSKRVQNAAPSKLGLDFKSWWVPRSNRRAGS